MSTDLLTEEYRWTVDCDCTVEHRTHTYKAANWGLCRKCSHDVRAHRLLEEDE